jgi:hypothetical protein
MQLEVIRSETSPAGYLLVDYRVVRSDRSRPQE